MVTLLEKIFIKNSEKLTVIEKREKYGSLCSVLGICLNIILCIGKFIAGSISGSIAITADATNNLSDAGSSLITLIGFKLAGKKPDNDHPFGYGRIEYISGLIVSLLILLMAFELIKESVTKIIHPEAVSFSWLIIAILAASILVKVYMYSYNKRIGRKIDSAGMVATAADSLSDSVSTAAVLVATLIAHFANINIDGYVGVLVGLFILYTGIGVVKETIGPLLGNTPSREFVDRVEEIVLSHDTVVGIHDLIVHDYGPGRVIITLHAEVPADADILEAHDHIDHIESELNEELNCLATIHLDPVAVNDENLNRKKEITAKVIEEINAEYAVNITFHDFRMVEGPTHTNLIFDIVIPREKHLNDREIEEKIKKGISKIAPECFCVITVDKPFVC